jgi:alkyl hydroperoxide reductase subunit AhpC
LSQLRQQESELTERNIKVKVVTFDADFMALAYVKETNLAWPLLKDTELSLYTAYGMGRGTWWDIYNPISVLNYLRLIFTGKGPGKPGRDWRQLGGDVLIDPEGIIRLHYVSADPHDRPSVDSILTLASG